MKTLLLCIVLLLLPCTFAGGHGDDVPAVIYLWCGQNKSLPDAAGIQKEGEENEGKEKKERSKSPCVIVYLMRKNIT